MAVTQFFFPCFSSLLVVATDLLHTDHFNKAALNNRLKQNNLKNYYIYIEHELLFAARLSENCLQLDHVDEYNHELTTHAL